MKRVIISAENLSPESRCEKYSKSTEKFLQDADNYLHKHDFRNLTYAIERAGDHSRILRSCIKKLNNFEEINHYSHILSEYMSRLSELRRALRSSALWAKLSGSEQYAADLAHQSLERLSTIWTEEDLESAAHEACFRVGEGNAEPEYENEEFYEDEPDVSKVIEYLRSLEAPLK